MDLAKDQPQCTYCKNYIQLPNKFRLYDPCRNDSEESRYFYRYESCKYCGQRYKIEYLTMFERESGVTQINYVENRLEGLSSEQFKMYDIIPESKNEEQILMIAQNTHYWGLRMLDDTEPRKA